MKIHYLQHVDFEGLSSIEIILKKKGHHLSRTCLYKNETLPSVDDIDWLIIMGGPMGIYDDEKYPWLTVEKKFIGEVIKADKMVLGICLGAQLIADVLGAKVYKNLHKEIGWFEINRLPEVNTTILTGSMPETVEVFHWHGDTFEIPEGATSLFKSHACGNQGFVYDNRVVGFQFHLETTQSSASALIENCRDELDGSQYVQTEKQMLEFPEKFQRINQVMFSVLTALEEKCLNLR